MSSLPPRDRWKELEPLFDAAVEMTSVQRDAYLVEVCRGDSALRAELDVLLRAYDTHDTALDHPAAERFSMLLDEQPVQVPPLLDDRYRIERELGRGGMATVYLATDTRHARWVAIKILHPQLARAIGAERFLTEIRTTARLQHPHLLPLHDSGEAHGLLFYVMPYVEGESLRRRLQREQQLPIDDAVRIVTEVAAALDSAHRQGVIHRDIKPENILLQDGSAQLADFGIALALSAANGWNGTTSPRVTSPGVVIGTPQYMSPEQAAGAEVIDARSDVYALSAVLYELLAGEPPFTAANAMAIMAKRSALPAPSVRVLRPTVPVALDAAIVRGLARDPGDRFGSAGEFASAVRRSVIPAAPGEAPPRARPRPDRARRLWSMVILVLLVFAAGAAFVRLLWQSRRATTAQERVATSYGERSIAVLPLLSIGNDSTNAFFTRGITDELASALANIAGTRVVFSDDAQFRSRVANVDPQAIGRDLHVAMILRGSVQRSATQLRVVIHLIGTGDGSTLWSQQFTQELRHAADVFAVEDDIVGHVARQLRDTLPAPRISAHPPTKNLVALNLFLQGKYFNDLGGLQSQAKALSYFQQAIAEDSGYGAAYSAVSDIYTSYGIGNVGDFPPADYFPRARAAAQHALAIDSLSAEALTAEAKVKLLYDFDWAGANRDFQRALEIDPHNLLARTFYAVLLEFTGRFDSAVVESRRALEDSPLSKFAAVEASRALLFDRQYSQVIVRLHEFLAHDAHYRAHLHLGQAFEQIGQLDSAVAEMKEAVRLAPMSSRTHAFLVHAYALAGRRDEALRELNGMHARARTGYVPAFDFAVAYLGLGDKDATFWWLERALQERSMRPYLRDPTFDPIRSDPRYDRLLDEMHLLHLSPAMTTSR